MVLCALSLLCTFRAYADDPTPAADTKQSTGLGGWLKKQAGDFKAGLHDRPVIATGYDSSRGQGVCREGATFPVWTGAAARSTNRTGVVGGNTISVDPNIGTCDALIQSGRFQRVAAADKTGTAPNATSGADAKRPLTYENDNCTHPSDVKGTPIYICHDQYGTQTGVANVKYNREAFAGHPYGYTALPPGYAVDINTGEFIGGGTKYRETGASCNHPTLIKTTTWHICHDDYGTQTGLFDRVKGFKELPPGYAIDTKTGEFIKGGDPRQAGVIRQQTGLTSDSDRRFDDAMNHANAQMDAIQEKIKSDAAAAKAKREARSRCIELKAHADMDGYRTCMQELPQ